MIPGMDTLFPSRLHLLTTLLSSQLQGYVITDDIHNSPVIIAMDGNHHVGQMLNSLSQIPQIILHISVAVSHREGQPVEVLAEPTSRLFSHPGGFPLRIFIHPNTIVCPNIMDFINRYESHGMLVDTVEAP
jgi:hypothetical protein